MKPTARAARRSGERSREARNDRVTQAYKQLRELIIWGRLAPGSRIIETDVAGRLGVSRTPVRSALQRLQQEGYIVSSGSGQQSRLAVAPLTKEDARELFAIVGDLEGLAAGWAAEADAGTRTAMVREMRRLNSELSQTLEGENPDHGRVFDLDQDFHRLYVNFGGGPRLKALHEAVKPQTERYVRLYISAFVDDIGRSVNEHELAVKAIEAGDADGAREAVLTNWRNAADRLCTVIDRLGERGTW
jgi:DNA-binding GntR family transcriptional regulator